MATKLGLRNAGIKTEFIYSNLNRQRTRGTLVAYLDEGVNTSADLPNEVIVKAMRAIASEPEIDYGDFQASD